LRYRTYVTLGGVAIAVTAGLYALERGIGDGLSSCGNQPIRTERSPDGALRAVLFERDCGATTGTSTQVSILAKDEILLNESGNTFIIRHEPAVGLTWIRARELEISYKPAETVFQKKTSVNSVSISYATKQ
jgi:hypothetical protein